MHAPALRVTITAPSCSGIVERARCSRRKTVPDLILAFAETQIFGSEIIRQTFLELERRQLRVASGEQLRRGQRQREYNRDRVHVDLHRPTLRRCHESPASFERTPEQTTATHGAP